MGGKWISFSVIHIIYHPLFFLFQIGVTSGAVDHKSTLYGAVEVVDYQHFRDVRILRFHIAPQAIRAVFKFTSFTSGVDCPEKAVSVHLQYSGLPLVTPHNETFPSRFYLGRTESQAFSIPRANQSILHTIQHPLAGDWYAAAFTTEIDDKITQKGLGPECKYFLEPVLIVQIEREVITLSGDHGSVNIKPESKKYVRFRVGGSVWQYVVRVTACTLTDDSIPALCNLTVAARSSALPTLTQGQTTCLHDVTNPCTYTVASPGLTSWQYVVFINQGSEEIKLDFNVDISACPSYITLSLIAGMLSLENRLQDCMVLSGLDRFLGHGDFSSRFGILGLSTILTPSTILHDKVTSIIPFTLDPAVSLGGTLKVVLYAAMRGTTNGVKASVIGCIERGSLGYHQDSITPCEGHSDRQLALNMSLSQLVRQELYVPYPEPGTWYLSMALLCYTDYSHTDRIDCGNASTAIEMDITTTKCVDGGCKNSGHCGVYLKGTSQISTCNCVAGWRGYDCSDGSKAVSHDDQLEEALLLTMSNLLFIPAILLALYRSYYAEAVVYFMTMFFSTFYHACDGNRVLIYCMTRYDILSACDFFGSVLSFWVTLVAMIRVKEPYTPTLLMMGTIGVVYGTLTDKHSLWLYVAPAISGFTLIVISWGLRCYGRRRLYPSWKRYAFFLLPGGLTALLGICLFAFVETSANYKYVHSAWHVTMALSILFVLPPRPPWKLPKNTSKISSVSTSSCSDPDECIQVMSPPVVNDTNIGVTVPMDSLSGSYPTD